MCRCSSNSIYYSCCSESLVMCMKAQIEKCICVRRFWIEENCHGSGAVTHSTHWVVASSRGQDPIPRRVQWWTETYPPRVQLGAIDRAAFLAFEAPWIGHTSDAANSGTTTLDSVFGLVFWLCISNISWTIHLLGFVTQLW